MSRKYMMHFEKERESERERKSATNFYFCDSNDVASCHTNIMTRECTYIAAHFSFPTHQVVEERYNHDTVFLKNDLDVGVDISARFSSSSSMKPDKWKTDTIASEANSISYVNFIEIVCVSEFLFAEEK